MNNMTVFFTKEFPQSLVSYKDFLRQIVYALRRAGVSFVFSQGFHPRPKIHSVASLSLGVVSKIEPIAIEIYGGHIDEDKLQMVLPQGIRYLGYVHWHIQEYLALYRYKSTYFVLSHPHQGLGAFIKKKKIPPYEIVKEDIIVNDIGSLRHYLGVK